MRICGSKSASIVIAGLLLAGTSAPAALGQQNKSNGPARDSGYTPNVRPFTSGQKAKVKGNIIHRDADTFTIRAERNVDMIVLLTDRTSVKSKGGFLRSGTNYDVTSLLQGLPVEVEGIGNQDGQLVADKVRFSNSDLKVARLVDTRVAPVEIANQRLSGQVDELGELSREAKGEAGRANERISALDDYDVQESVTVYFRTNSSVLTPEDKRQLNELAQKAMSAKGFVIEIAGHADSTGNVARNRVLSQQRADAVVRYLQENHEIPLRRMVTPFGYGQMRPAADNTSAEGRRQNRRVEVKVLVSRGITASGS